jgi:hypothetical protein
MELSEEDRAVLAHVVVNVDEWVANAIAVVGEIAVTEKIDAYRAEYLLAVQSPDYKVRADRDEDITVRSEDIE